MSIRRPTTGLEHNPNRFQLSSISPPPAAAMPAEGADLVAELADLHVKWQAARDRHRELSTDKVRRAARAEDAQALGAAVRAGNPIPDPVAEQQLDADIEAAEQEMRQHEAAGSVAADELDNLIATSADDQAATFRTQLDAAVAAEQQAIADLEQARNDMVNAANFLTYWRQVANGQGARWGGRPTGPGSNLLRGPSGNIQLERFANIANALRQENSRIAAAVADDEPTA